MLGDAGRGAGYQLILKSLLSMYTMLQLAVIIIIPLS